MEQKRSGVGIAAGILNIITLVYSFAVYMIQVIRYPSIYLEIHQLFRWLGMVAGWCSSVFLIISLFRERRSWLLIAAYGITVVQYIWSMAALLLDGSYQLISAVGCEYAPENGYGDILLRSVTAEKCGLDGEGLVSASCSVRSYTAPQHPAIPGDVLAEFCISSLVDDISVVPGCDRGRVCTPVLPMADRAGETKENCIIKFSRTVSSSG